MFPVVLLFAGALLTLALMSGRGEDSSSHRPGASSDGTYEPPGDPAEVVEIILDEFISQSIPRNRIKLEKLLREKLTTKVDETTWQISMPCDLEGTPSFDRISDLSLAIGEAYGVPVRVDRTNAGRYPFAVISVGPHPVTPDLSGFDRESMGRHESAPRRGQERFGGILDLIMNTVIASSVGTVTSMGTQSLVHSMGGEPRLARILRHYRKAEARGDEAAMSKIRAKVTRSASRIKGRKVDWSEVERLTSQSGT